MKASLEERLIQKDLERKGFQVEPCRTYNTPYYDFIAYSGAVTLLVDAKDRRYSDWDLTKFKELADLFKGRAVKAHCRRLFGFLGLKITYTDI